MFPYHTSKFYMHVLKITVISLSEIFSITISSSALKKEIRKEGGKIAVLSDYNVCCKSPESDHR